MDNFIMTYHIFVCYCMFFNFVGFQHILFFLITFIIIETLIFVRSDQCIFASFA